MSLTEEVSYKDGFGDEKNLDNPDFVDPVVFEEILLGGDPFDDELEMFQDEEPTL